MADERSRYSDAELEEFKQVILKKLENARADYELLRATITHTADNDTEDTSPTYKVLEEGAGICKTTGKLIPKERLMKVPHATECIEAKESRR